MSETGCLNDAHLNNINVSGKAVFNTLKIEGETTQGDIVITNQDGEIVKASATNQLIAAHGRTKSSIWNGPIIGPLTQPAKTIIKELLIFNSGNIKLNKMQPGSTSKIALEIGVGGGEGLTRDTLISDFSAETYKNIINTRNGDDEPVFLGDSSNDLDWRRNNTITIIRNGLCISGAEVSGVSNIPLSAQKAVNLKADGSLYSETERNIFVSIRAIYIGLPLEGMEDIPCMVDNETEYGANIKVSVRFQHH